MGMFYDKFYKRGEEIPIDSLRVSLPDYKPTPQGYGALMSADYAACEQTKARSLASLPFSIVDFSKGKPERINHHLVDLLNGMVNEEISAPSLMDWLTLRRDTFGTAYLFLDWYKGRVRAIYPVTAQVQRFYDRDKPKDFRVTYQIVGDDYVPDGTYYTSEVLAIPTHITRNGYEGESLARLAAEEIGLSIDLEQFYKSMLKNGNHHLGHVELPAGNFDEKKLNALRTALEMKAGVNEAGRAPIFGYGAKWVSDNISMSDASIIEQQQWILQQVCRFCNVPPWKVYDGTNTTYAGGQQANIDYVTETIMPDVRQIEIAFKPILKLLGLPNAQAKFRLQGLMRGDDASRTQYYRELGYIGAITRKDIRELEDFAELPGLDAPLFPLNYGTVNDDGTVNVFNSKTPGNSEQTGEANV